MRIWGERQRRELFEGTSHHGFHHWYFHQPTMGIVVIILGPTFSRLSQWQAGRGRTPHRRPGPGLSLKHSWDSWWWQNSVTSQSISQLVDWFLDCLIDCRSLKEMSKCLRRRLRQYKMHQRQTANKNLRQADNKTWDKPTEMQHPSRCNQVALQLRFLNHPHHNTCHNFPIRSSIIIVIMIILCRHLSKGHGWATTGGSPEKALPPHFDLKSLYHIIIMSHSIWPCIVIPVITTSITKYTYTNMKYYL